MVPVCTETRLRFRAVIDADSLEILFEPTARTQLCEGFLTTDSSPNF
jgi:hypothetical protein